MGCSSSSTLEDQNKIEIIKYKENEGKEVNKKNEVNEGNKENELNERKEENHEKEEK